MDFSTALANLNRQASQASAQHERGSKRPRENDDQYGPSTGQSRSGGGGHRGGSRHYHYHRGGSYRGGRNDYYEREDREVLSSRTSTELEPLRRHGYHFEPFLAPPPAPIDGARRIHMCLLAIVIDELPYDHIWKVWASEEQQGIANVTVSMIVHAKYPPRAAGASDSPTFLQRHHITHYPPRRGRGTAWADPSYLSHNPNWGSVNITRAMVDLLRCGVRIGRADSVADNDDGHTHRRFVLSDAIPTQLASPDYFLFVSETCLPVATLSEVGEELRSRDARSWINARNLQTPGTPRNKYESDQFALLHPAIPEKMRFKADQWVLLNASHANAIVNVDSRDGHRHGRRGPDQPLSTFAFTRINASDEMYVPTVLSLLGVLKDEAKIDKEGADLSSGADSAGTSAVSATRVIDAVIECSEIQRRPVTYTDWTQGMRNPASFGHGIVDYSKVAALAREQGCLMARKFVPRLTGNPEPTGAMETATWWEALQQISSDVPLATRDAAPASTGAGTSITGARLSKT